MLVLASLILLVVIYVANGIIFQTSELIEHFLASKVFPG
jgi:hypothetical protein